MAYLIGQRVIADGQIVVCIRPPSKKHRENDETTQWIRFQDNIERWYSVHNIKPLPNGQL